MDNADGFTCCRDNLLLDEELVVADSIFDEPGDEDESVHPSDVSDATERVVRSYFERGDPDEVVIDLETVCDNGGGHMSRLHQNTSTYF